MEKTTNVQLKMSDDFFYENEEKQYDKDGLILCEQILPSDYFQKVSRKVDHLLADDPKTFELTNLHLKLDWMLEICSRREFVNRACRFLKCDSVYIISSIILIKQPYSKLIVPWHQDAAYGWPFEPLECTSAWLSIDQATSENGAMEVAVGAHKNGFFPLTDKKNLNSGEFLFTPYLKESISPDLLEDFPKEKCQLNPGDATFHNCRLPHQSLPNTTDRRRCALIIRFCRGDAVLVEEKVQKRSDLVENFRPILRHYIN